MDDALKHAFTDAYLRHGSAFTQFTTSNSAAAAEDDQQARYQEFANAQHAFLQSAHRLARSLLEQAEGQGEPPQAITQAPKPEPGGVSDWMELPDEPTDEPEPAPEPDEPQGQEVSGRPARKGFFRFGRLG